MNKIEAVARAISETAGIDWQDLTIEARAAIEAMRNPDHNMLRAGDKYGGAGKCGNAPVTEAVWHAMIAVALEETP